MTLKHTLKQWALRCGIEVRRYNAIESSEARLGHQLKLHRVGLVLDVGANDGGYGRLLRGLGYRGEIVSFEPLSDAHAALSRATAADPLWHVAPRMALGAENGTVTINIAGNSASSSVLPMGKLHAEAAPESRYTGAEPVPLCRLDSVTHPALAGGSPMLLKIDTQGFEMAVLRGAAGLLPRVAGVQVELSVVPLYEGQAAYREVIDFLEAAGFGLWNVMPGFADARSGRMLQFDGIFFRPPQ
jgi:FkbM family methyltransferase